MKQAQLQWSQDPRGINGDTVIIIRCEASIYFRIKMRECLKGKIHEPAMNSKNKNIRDLHGGIIEFKRGLQTKK
jgi:hypothetical protein